MFDLHVHTNASDGELSPKEIIKEAKENEITKIAITDHDTLLNVNACIEEGKKNNVLVIPGIEISAEVDKGEMHILGYGIDINNLEFNQVMILLRDSRNEKNKKIVKALRDEFGIDITLDDVKKFSVGDSLGRPHFALAMMEKGIVNSVREAFDKYLSQTVITDIKRLALKPKAAIELINNAGGIAVLAHPHSLKLSDEETYEKIKELKSYGLAGIEAYHSDHSQEKAEIYKNMAKNENLIITCGSDFHGRGVKPKIKLGSGIDNNLPTDNEEIFDNFFKRLNEQKNKNDYSR